MFLSATLCRNYHAGLFFFFSFFKAVQSEAVTSDESLRCSSLTSRPERLLLMFFFSSLQLVNRHLYSGSADRTVKCWLVDTGERIQTYKAHKHSVSTLKYHAGICKLPFLCSAIPCLLLDVCLWSKIANRGYCNCEGLWNCHFFQLQHVLCAVSNSAALLRVRSLDLPSIFHLPLPACEGAAALFLLGREVAWIQSCLGAVCAATLWPLRSDVCQSASAASLWTQSAAAGCTALCLPLPPCQHCVRDCPKPEPHLKSSLLRSNR